MADKRIVLIHGAWQGSWSFAAWLPLLQAQGWQVHAVDLPGNGWGALADAPASLEAYTAHVVALLDRLAEPAVVLGHSGGGITAAQVAETRPERVAALVYLAGMMLPSGQSYVDVQRHCQLTRPAADLAGIAAHLQWTADRSASSVPADAAQQIFMHDCEPEAARRAAALLRPQPESGRAMRNHLTPERFGRVPRLYVECRADRSLALPVQRLMQSLSPGAQRLSLDCGHVPQLAQPQRLTELLCAALEPLMQTAGSSA